MANVDSFSPIGGTYRPRYVGVGVGGTLQNITPPGPGSQAETASVPKVERSLQVNPGLPVQWYKQVLPSPDPTDPAQFPTAYSSRIRGIFGYDDVSFPGCKDALDVVYGTDVPISEVGLYTSQAALTTIPGAAGLIAYHTFRPISKTPNFVLELAWDLKF